MSCMSMACGRIQAELRRRNILDAGHTAFRMHRVSDKSEICRRVLGCDESIRASSTAIPAEHIFGDLNDRLSKEVKAVLDIYVPATHMSKEEKNDVFGGIKNVLSANADQMTWENTAFCHLHKKQCPLNPSKVGEMDPLDVDNPEQLGEACRPWRVNMAGHSCLGWSMMGKQEGQGHLETGRPYAIWTTERSALREDMIFGECTEHFDVELARQELPHHRPITLMVSPDMLGWPCRRPRSFTVYLNPCTVVWTGPPADECQRLFNLLFKKNIMVDGNEVCCAPEKEKLQYMLAKVRNRALHVPQEQLNMADVRLHEIMPSGEYDRYLAYTKKQGQLQGLTGSFFAEVSQNPHSCHGNSCGHLLPVFLRSGEIFNFKSQCYVTTKERFAAMGIGVFEETGFDCPFDVGRLSYAEANSLVGNGMSLPAITAWLCFVLAHVVRRSSAEGLEHSILQASTVLSIPEDEEDDEESEGSSPVLMRKRPASILSQAVARQRSR